MLSTQKSLKPHNLETFLQLQRDVDVNKIQQLEAPIETLIEYIESLKLKLDYKTQKLEKSKQELIYTYHELSVL